MWTAVHLEGLDGLLVCESLKRFAVHFQNLISYTGEHIFRLRWVFRKSVNILKINFSLILCILLSYTQYNRMKRNGYPLSVVHLLLQRHEGKWFWQKSPSDHGQSPAHQQYWIQGPIKVISQIMADSLVCVELKRYNIYIILATVMLKHRCYIWKGKPFTNMWLSKANI